MKQWILGEFTTGEGMLAAVRVLRELEVGELETYSPHPVEGEAVAMGRGRTGIRFVAFFTGLLVFGSTYTLEWWCNRENWPLNVGNRPAFAYPPFVLPAYEGLILCTSFAIVVALFIALRLPELWHPAFEVEAFKSASLDRFWVSVTVEGERAPKKVAAELERLGATQVSIVEEPS